MSDGLFGASISFDPWSIGRLPRHQAFLLSIFFAPLRCLSSYKGWIQHLGQRPKGKV